MKKRLLAIMKPDGRYLSEFETRGNNVLSFGARWTDGLERALLVDWDKIKDDEENTAMLRKWADVVDGKLVVIEMDYRIKELDSNDSREECNETPQDKLAKEMAEFFERV